MDQVVDELRGSNNPLDQIWMQDKPRFLQMMILDGCFSCWRFFDPIMVCLMTMLTMILSLENTGNSMSCHISNMTCMLMLENQLPLMVLRILIEIENDTTQIIN